MGNCRFIPVIYPSFSSNGYLLKLTPLYWDEQRISRKFLSLVCYRYNVKHRKQTHRKRMALNLNEELFDSITADMIEANG